MPLDAGRVTIVMPTKNRCSLLGKTLDSVRAQTYPHWEVVVVDDGSDDGTHDLLDEVSLKDFRIRWIERQRFSPEEGGAQVCRNLGARQGEGDYVLFLDSDDLLGPHCLEQRTKALREEPELDFIVGNCERFNDNAGDCAGKYWAEWNDGDKDLDGFLGIGSIPWQTSGPLWRRSALAQVGPWDETLVHVGHDHEFHVRALCRGVVGKRLPQVDYYWRQPRADSLSSFESFNKHHGAGNMIKVYAKILESVSENQCWIPKRQRAQADEAVRLAIRCRMNGGSSSTAMRAIELAREHGLMNGVQVAECRMALKNWFRLGGKIPSLAYLSRRFPGAA